MQRVYSFLAGMWVTDKTGATSMPLATICFPFVLYKLLKLCRKCNRYKKGKEMIKRLECTWKTKRSKNRSMWSTILWKGKKTQELTRGVFHYMTYWDKKKQSPDCQIQFNKTRTHSTNQSLNQIVSRSSIQFIILPNTMTTDLDKLWLHLRIASKSGV